MSGQPDLLGTHNSNRVESRSEPAAAEDKQRDVWAELFGIVNSLAATNQTALQAFTPSDEKAVSATTKKRLALRTIHELKQSHFIIETLVEHLKALQAASSTWQRSMMYASKSHQELMDQVQSTTEELHETSERLRSVEAQRLAAVREAEFLRARTEQQETIVKETQNSLKQKEEDLETLQFSLHEQQSSLSVVQHNLEVQRQAASEADERAKTAAVALHEAKADATKAQGLAERHQQVVAKLTADNLVFLMQLKKAEADLASASWERAQLRLAVEQQQGPWFDQVRAGVEDRVRHALQQSQELEASLERQEVEHAAQLEAMQKQQYQLEEQLKATRQHADDLEKHLAYAHDSKECLEGRHAEAEATVRELRQELDNLAAENRVLQESMRSMRQECTERWVNEQAALGRVDGLEQRICELHEALSQITAEVTALQRQLDTQKGINRQLMARKEEMEWQLMVAMLKMDHAADQLAPLSHQVSGLHNVVGPNQQHARSNLEAPVPGQICSSAVYPAGAGGRVVGGDGDPRPPSSSSGNSRNASEETLQGAATGPTAAGMKTASLPTIHYSTDATGLAPEPTLLVAHDDEATVVHTGGIHGRGDAGMTGISDFKLVSPLQTQPQQGAREDSGTLDVVRTQTRRTSLEGLSLGVINPSNSVGLSSCLEWSCEAPCESNRLMPDVAAITIRTVSQGQRLNGGPPHAKYSAVSGTGVQEGWQAGVCGVQASGSGSLVTHTTASDSQAPNIQRCSSLHDGDDVWLPNILVSSSSDNSDVFSPGVVAYHEPHMRELHQVHTTAQQPQLQQLQQQLQVHLQMQTAAWQVTRPAQQRHGQDPDPCVALQQQALAYGTKSVARDQREDDDSICSRNVLQLSGPSREGTRGPTISIRSTPSQPAGARPLARGAASMLVKAQKPNDHGDNGMNVLSIIKGGSQRDMPPLCCASPRHPALSPKQRDAIARVASAGSERPPERAPDGGAVSTSGVVLERVSADRVEGVASMVRAQPLVEDSVSVAPVESSPVSVQAHQPICSMEGALDSIHTAALECWTLSGAVQQQMLSSPASPARSVAFLRCPPSPPHPAISRGEDMDSNRAVGGAASVRGLVSVPRETPPEGPRGYTVACSDVQGTRATPATQPAVSDGHRASAVVRGLDASTATPDEGTAAAPGGPASRHRVSYQRLFDDISPTSSSTGSFTQADGRSSMQPQHKPSSVKCVRFSDHEADDDMLLVRPSDGLEQRVSATGSQPQRASSAVDADLSGGRFGAIMQQARAAVATEGPQAYKSRGPVAHPAMLGLHSPTKSSYVIGVDAADGTPPKRYSAVLVATTAVPRGFGSSRSGS